MLTAMARELVTQNGAGEEQMSSGGQIQPQQAYVLECSRPVIVEVPIPALSGNRSAEAALSSSSQTTATTSAALVDLALESPRPDVRR